MNETVADAVAFQGKANQISKRNLKNETFVDNSTAIYNRFGNLKNTSMRVIVHGFGSSCTHVWIYEMRTALMAVEDCFVLCIDWENGASLPNYVRAAANSRLVSC